jgi:hypothetical protein
MADEPAEAGRPGMDPLKAYCWIFLALVVALGVYYIKTRNSRRAIQAANKTAEGWFTESTNTTYDRPNDIPSIAFEVERYADAFEASGGETENVISLAKMDALATQSRMRRSGNRSAPPEPNSRGYQTITESYDYDPDTLDHLIILAFNVESTTRYRVMEMDWALLPEKENNQMPFHRIGRSSLKVAFRTALRKSDQ